MIVYLPILTLTGVEGKMFTPMAITVLLALTGAALLSVTFVPAALALFVTGVVHERESFIVRGAQAVYEPMLSGAIANRAVVVTGAVVLTAVCLLLATRLGSEFIPSLDEGDVVCGYRRTRRDSWSKRAASRIANHIRKTVLGDGIRDTGCSLKAVRREHLRYLVPFNAMHRFIPALLVNCGLKIVEVPVNHRHRTRGVSKYTVAGRAWRGLRDLLGVRWFLSRQIRWDLDPHHHV
jgi:Cu/Ag efflux pump CusA